MTTANTEVMIEGRLVNGHPMTRRPVTKKNPQTHVEEPLLDQLGQQVTDVYFAVAIPKAGSVDWKLTAWGAPIAARAVADWPNGEHLAPAFSWKIIDGDSAVPNQKGKKPCEREGWAGHWVVHCSTRFACRSFHVGKYDPTQQIQVENEIKTGDYCRALLGVKGNNPSQSPGIYTNPQLFELSRAGTPIVGEGGPSAADAFGGGAPVAAAPVAAAPVAAAPAPDLLQPGQAAPAPAAPVEVKYMTPDGGQWTEAQLIAAGYNAQQVAALPRA